MSASRALASARNRKAGGNNPSPSTPYQDNNSFSQNDPIQGMSTPTGAPIKISMAKAIQLLGERISGVEQMVSTNMQIREDTNSIINSQVNSDMENKYLVDKEVFDDIISRVSTLEIATGNESSSDTSDIVTRIETLEKQSTKSGNTLDTDDINQKIASLQSTQPLVSDLMNLQSELTNNFASNDNLVTSLRKEVEDLKMAVVNLQKFTMETNSRLSDIVFSESRNGAEFTELFKDHPIDDHPVPTISISEDVELDLPNEGNNIIDEDASNVIDFNTSTLKPPTLVRSETHIYNKDLVPKTAISESTSSPNVFEKMTNSHSEDVLKEETQKTNLEELEEESPSTDN
tara:strand:- start:10223 stop:11260 length:1038 start_codon:yes stop_codon:yes gene_type:complete